MKTAGGGGFPRLARVTACLMLMLTGLGTGAWAEEQVVYTLDGTQTASNTDYATAGVVNQGGITWMVTGNVNQNPWRIGGKSISGVDRPIWSENALDGTVTRVNLDFGDASASITVNSITLTVAGDADFTDVIDTKAVDFSANNTVDVTPTEGKEWKNAYYRFVFNVTVSAYSNRYIKLNSIKFYNDPDAQQQGGGGTEPVAGTFTAALAEGTEDAANWTVKVGDGTAQALPVEGLSEGQTLTLTYTGSRRVKSVTATWTPAVTWNTVDLSTLTADYTAQDGDVLTGTLGGNYKITIADGATVTLSGAVINGASYGNWAGLTLAGDGTIILSGENTVKGFYEDYPGIFVLENKTLTIQGDGSLTASSNGYGAGIGGGYNIACGNIVIAGGTVTATGGKSAAGIGSGRSSSCGNISITGGTVTATGGQYSAGIGGGRSSSCGDITIANTVTKVTATKGDNATNSIGAGLSGTCGTVTIGGNVGAITESPYTYQPSN